MLKFKVRNKRSSPKTRHPAQLSEALNRRLGSYALSATAAGVAALACSVRAEAAPVCKKLSIQLSATDTFALNPANQVAAPFNIAQSTFSYTTSGGYYSPWWNRGFFVPNSAGANVLLGEKSFPANLAAGAQIGPGAQFGKGKTYGLLFTYGEGSIFFEGGGTLKKHRGNFDLQQSNYVGFEFSQGGKTHYGWARLEVKFVRKQYYEPETVIQVQGYGYETNPGVTIAAGSCATSGDKADDSMGNGDGAASTDATAIQGGTAALNVSNGAVLGMLAAGNVAVTSGGSARTDMG